MLITKGLLALAVGGLVAGGGTVAFASQHAQHASSSASAVATTATTATTAKSAKSAKSARDREFGGTLEHGRLTVKTRRGVETVDAQLGTVAAVSATAVTVRSADGTSVTYLLGPASVVRVAGARSHDLSTVSVGATARALGLVRPGQQDLLLRLVSRPATPKPATPTPAAA